MALKLKKLITNFIQIFIMISFNIFWGLLFNGFRCMLSIVPFVGPGLSEADDASRREYFNEIDYTALVLFLVFTTVVSIIVFNTFMAFVGRCFHSELVQKFIYSLRYNKNFRLKFLAGLYGIVLIPFHLYIVRAVISTDGFDNIILTIIGLYALPIVIFLFLTIYGICLNYIALFMWWDFRRFAVKLFKLVKRRLSGA